MLPTHAGACCGNAQVGFGSSLTTGSSVFGITEFGRKFSTPWWWYASGIARLPARLAITPCGTAQDE
jgi:hypothetical protein